MITLITGTPGSGKSVMAVWYEIKKAVEAGRTVYSSGIPRLQLPAIQLTDAQVRDWYHVVEKVNPLDPDEIPLLRDLDEGSLIVIDEVQRIWRPTGAGVVPPDIAALETHRHHGLDFVVISQHPSLLHRNVRALVGKHIHLRATALGNYLYEFPEWCENPQTKSARASCVRSRYRLPKQAFALYESASIHVKVSKRKPIQYFILIFVAIAVPLGAFSVYSRIASRTEVSPSSASFTQLHPGTNSDISNQNNHLLPVAENRPVYTDVSMVSNQIDWSKVGGCVESKKQCFCFGENAERLAVAPESCTAAVKYSWGGRPLKVAEKPSSENPAKHLTSSEEEAKQGDSLPTDSKWKFNNPDEHANEV